MGPGNLKLPPNTNTNKDLNIIRWFRTKETVHKESNTVSVKRREARAC